MKIRSGFVSNSSSSSFILSLKSITFRQTEAVLDPYKFCKDWNLNDNYWYCENSPWSVEDTYDPTVIIRYTNMDNFDMMAFFEYIGISDKACDFYEYYKNINIDKKDTYEGHLEDTKKLIKDIIDKETWGIENLEDEYYPEELEEKRNRIKMLKYLLGENSNEN